VKYSTFLITRFWPKLKNKRRCCFAYLPTCCQCRFSWADMNSKRDVFLTVLCVCSQLKNADFFSNFITEDFRTYIARKKLAHTHGNHLEMQAMAEMYNRNFEVYQYSTGGGEEWGSALTCAKDGSFTLAEYCEKHWTLWMLTSEAAPHDTTA